MMVGMVIAVMAAFLPNRQQSARGGSRRNGGEDSYGYGNGKGNGNGNGNGKSRAAMGTAKTMTTARTKMTSKTTNTHQSTERGSGRNCGNIGNGDVDSKDDNRQGQRRQWSRTCLPMGKDGNDNGQGQ
jgi:hypothetical protein